MTTLGQKLSYLRKQRKVREGHRCTLQYVSDFTGLAVSYISDLEHDRTEPSLKTLKTLAKFYHVKPSYLIDDDNELNNGESDKQMKRYCPICQTNEYDPKVGHMCDNCIDRYQYDMLDPALANLSRLDEYIHQALSLIDEFGYIDSKHHKRWLIDQVLRCLMSAKKYQQWRQDNPEWDEGIKP